MSYRNIHLSYSNLDILNCITILSHLIFQETNVTLNNEIYTHKNGSRCSQTELLMVLKNESHIFLSLFFYVFFFENHPQFGLAKSTKSMSQMTMTWENIHALNSSLAFHCISIDVESLEFLLKWQLLRSRTPNVFFFFF